MFYLMENNGFHIDFIEKLGFESGGKIINDDSVSSGNGEVGEYGLDGENRTLGFLQDSIDRFGQGISGENARDDLFSSQGEGYAIPDRGNESEYEN